MANGRADTTLSIGELATRSGVSAEAIRYYEREHVVPAAARGGPGRYRQYDEADVERLQFIPSTASARRISARYMGPPP